MTSNIALAVAKRKGVNDQVGFTGGVFPVCKIALKTFLSAAASRLKWIDLICPRNARKLSSACRHSRQSARCFLVSSVSIEDNLSSTSSEIFSK